MARPRKQISDPKKRAAHAAALAKRREARAERMALKRAVAAAEGSADFETLVEAEKRRHESRKQTVGRMGGSKSPRIMELAREDLALAFDLIGGVPALVVWGRANLTEFYRIWSKLVPSSASQPAQALPLEELLSKLAEREGQTVLEAATAIGEEALEQGRKATELEDIQALGRLQIN